MNFNFCPQCGHNKITYCDNKKYSCENCGWEFFLNPAAAVAGIIVKEDKILVLVRNQDPGKGLWDLPGGFVDPGESAEDALKREVLEELGVVIKDVDFLCSYPNLYDYKDITYPTCDICFTTSIGDVEIILEKEENSEYLWVSKKDVADHMKKFAFSSAVRSLDFFLKDKCL